MLKQNIKTKNKFLIINRHSGLSRIVYRRILESPPAGGLDF